MDQEQAYATSQEKPTDQDRGRQRTRGAARDFTCHLSPVEAEGVEPTIVEGLETYEFIDLGDGRTEHRWLLRADDRTPEGIRAFEESNAFLKEISTHPTWGDQMRVPIAEDAAMYGLDHPVG